MRWVELKTINSARDNPLLGVNEVVETALKVRRNRAQGAIRGIENILSCRTRNDWKHGLKSCSWPLSGPSSQSHSLIAHLEHEVRDSTNERRDPDGHRRLEASVGIGIGELRRDLAGNGDSARWCTFRNVGRGVLAGGGEEGVEVGEDLDWRAVGGLGRVGLERARVGGEHGTAVDDVLSQVHVRGLGDVVNVDVVAPGVSGSALGLLVYVGPRSLEIRVLYMRD